jgi:hypothetical protein
MAYALINDVFSISKKDYFFAEEAVQIAPCYCMFKKF